MAVTDAHTFTCAECGEAIDVNASMREALISHGCVICGATVTDADFS
jgi:predicted RNA-binding Zn-ribbon protein involved in translation (DUF1610 family)